MVIGGLQALYGPAIPAFRATFGATPAVAGLGLSAEFTGALIGIVGYHLLLTRAVSPGQGDRQLLRWSYALMALGTIGFALAPSWPLSLAAAVVTGLGSGGIDYGLNHLFTIGYGHRSAGMLNLLNAYFGVGAVIGPALIGWVGAGRYPWLFGAVAVLSALLIPTLRGVRPMRVPAEPGAVIPAPSPSEISKVSSPGPGHPRSRTRVIVAAFVAIYVLYVAIESGVGGWEPTRLEVGRLPGHGRGHRDLGVLAGPDGRPVPGHPGQPALARARHRDRLLCGHGRVPRPGHDPVRRALGLRRPRLHVRADLGHRAALAGPGRAPGGRGRRLRDGHLDARRHRVPAVAGPGHRGGRGAVGAAPAGGRGRGVHRAQPLAAPCHQRDGATRPGAPGQEPSSAYEPYRAGPSGA